MTHDLADSAWPATRVGEALLSLVPAHSATRTVPSLNTAIDMQDAAASSRWIETTARRIGLRATAIETTRLESTTALMSMRAALLRLPGSDETRFLVLLGRRGKRLRLLGPDHVVRTLPLERVRSALWQATEQRLGEGIDRLMQTSGLNDAKRIRAGLLAERLRNVRLEVGWLVQPPDIGPLRPQFERSGLHRRLAIFVGVHAASHAAWILAWLTVGDDALQGRLDIGWLIAGAILLATFAALRITADRLQFVISVRLGMLLRQRLFEGALALDAQAARGQGMGQFLGRIFEAQAVEELAVSGGLSAATATLELVAAFVILAWGAGAWGLAGLLAAAIAVCFALAARHLVVRRRWTANRRRLTCELIERMVGHRTRAVQQDRMQWHGAEDQALSAYLDQSRSFDATMVWLVSAVPRGWLLGAAIGLGWTFSAGTSNATLALMMWASLLAFESFRNLVQGLPALAGAWVALQEVKPLLQAAAGEPTVAGAMPVARPTRSNTAAAESQLEAQAVGYGTRTHGRRVLCDVSLCICTGDRVLLEGPSGGGKSTLAALLAGLRQPDEGVLLLDGLDLRTLGTNEWRTRVALAAQFHENHVVSETLAFNLLMGRPWPPTAGDLRDAEVLCREVGLGKLLDRMPAGLDQYVGESGWQLSHGEKSRLYLVRALLQDAQLVVLDECFAALDPASLRATLDCVRKRAPALLVVAHP